MDPNIVILAGGISSRMKKSSPSLDDALRADVEGKVKAMIGVGAGSRPFLDYLFYNIERAGYRDIILVVGERDSSIREYYDNRRERFSRLNISFATQAVPAGRQKPPGTADALLCALRSAPSWVNRKFTVCNSDNLYSVNALKLLRSDTHENAMIDYDRSGLKFDPDRICDFAVTRKDADGYLTDIVEKPSQEEMLRATDRAGRIGVSMNIFRLSYNAIYPFLEAVPFHPSRDEKELPMAVRMMVALLPRSVYAIPLREHVLDLTSPSDIPEVVKSLGKEFPDGDPFAKGVM